jgi:parvulin-like peptidyl-prolyl isomerase
MLRRRIIRITMGRRLQVGVVCLLFLSLCLVSAASAQEKIVAVVNNDIITQKDLNDFVKFIRMQLSQELKGRELEEKLQSMKLDLIDKLIEDRLILQEARKNNATVEISPKNFISIMPEESRVKARLEEIKKRYGSDAQFQEALAKDGLTQLDIEKKFREQMLMYNIVDFKVKSKITVKPSEVTRFYEQNLDDFKLGEEREFNVVKLADKNMADVVTQDLAAGAGWEEIVKKYSLSPSEFSALQDGRLRRDIENLVFRLELLKVTGPIGLEDGFYLFRLNKQNPGRQQMLPEVKERIYNYLFEKKMADGLSKWLAELKAEAYIKIMQE